MQGRVIMEVGQGCRPEELPPAREYVDAQGALVMPGLVNTHCHAPMVWFRGLADDLPLQQWLTEFIFPAEGGWLDADKAYRGDAAGPAEMIRGGITTVADGYFYEAEVRRALGRRRPPGGGGPGGGGLSRPPGSRTPGRNLVMAADFPGLGGGLPRPLSPPRFSATPPTPAGPRPCRGPRT